MQTYINSFVRGRELLKKLLIADLVCAVLATVMSGSVMALAFFAAATVLVFIAIIYIAVKYCRCPNCGKLILLGVLAVQACPRCKRNLVSGRKVKKTR